MDRIVIDGSGKFKMGSPRAYAGRLASTLRGNDAEDFQHEAQDEHGAEAQQLMARVTGNYKHGNERAASQHPRNRK